LNDLQKNDVIRVLIKNKMFVFVFRHHHQTKHKKASVDNIISFH